MQIDAEYCQWLTEELFNLEFTRMLELLRLESKLVLARFSSQIAVKMVSLAMEEDEKIARQYKRFAPKSGICPSFTSWDHFLSFSS
jgi:hypothetical protein